jgi:hypothetical protein
VGIHIGISDDSITALKCDAHADIRVILKDNIETGTRFRKSEKERERKGYG